VLQAPPFDLFAPGAGSLIALCGARVSGLLLVAPVFSARMVPPMVKAGLIVLLTVLMVPVATAHLPVAPELTPATVLGETLVGFVIGLGAALLVGAAEAAGELMAIQIGLSGASIMDPVNQHQVPALGQFMQLTAIALLLGLDLHLVMLDAVAASTRLLPIGMEMDLAGGARAMVGLGSTLFLLGLRFAAPVVASVLIANVALAVLSRAAPQLNVLSVAFPLQIGVGLFALAASIPLIATFFTNWSTPYDDMVGRVLRVLGGG